MPNQTDPVTGSAEELIVLEDAAFGYGGPPVISGVDLMVRRGDFLGIVGPNGAGKTTLLRGIIGTLEPVKGQVRLNRTATGGKPVLGYVPQVQTLDPIFPVTVDEVVGMGGYSRVGRLGPIPAAEREFLAECLREVGMERVRKDLFASLSAGQKQRVLIARALMTRPDVLLLDEPTSGVDQAAEEDVMNLLGRLNGEGLAIVLICHEMDTVRRTVRDVVWISRSRIERGSAEEMLSEAVVRRNLEAGKEPA